MLVLVSVFKEIVLRASLYLPICVLGLIISNSLFIYSYSECYPIFRKVSCLYIVYFILCHLKSLICVEIRRSNPNVRFIFLFPKWPITIIRKNQSINRNLQMSEWQSKNLRCFWYNGLVNVLQ